MLRLSQYLNVSLEWLRSGEGSPSEPAGSVWPFLEEPDDYRTVWTQDNQGHTARAFRALPLLLSSDPFDPEDWDWFEIGRMLAERCLPIDDVLASRLGGRAFAVYVPDQAMSPTIRVGDIAIIDPDCAPTPSSLVVARDDREEHLFVRRYKQSRGHQGLVHELVPEDRYWPSIIIEGQIKIVGTVQALMVFPNAL